MNKIFGTNHLAVLVIGVIDLLLCMASGVHVVDVEIRNEEMVSIYINLVIYNLEQCGSLLLHS